MAESEQDKIYSRDFTADYGESLVLLAKHIPTGSRVLDIGCGAGDLGAYLRAEKDATVVGVDYSATSLAIAATKLNQTIQVDLNQQPLDAVLDAMDGLGKASFDVIVMADILEHLYAPDGVLTAALAYLKPDGKILISIPNAAYVGALIGLYDDDWRYRDEGILDRTHVRFYTKKTVMALLDDSGYDGCVCDRVARDLLDSEFAQRIDSQVDAVRRWLLAKPEGSTYQFIVEARPKSQAYTFPTEPPSPPMSLQHIVILYWQTTASQAFHPRYCGVLRGQMGQKNTLRFATGSNRIEKIRLDFADRRSVYTIETINILEATTEAILWSSALCSSALCSSGKGAASGDYATAIHHAFSSTAQLLPNEEQGQRLPLTLMAHDAEAHLELVLPAVISGQQLAVEVTMTAPVSELNTAFVDIVSLAQYREAIAQQQHLASELAQLLKQSEADHCCQRRSQEMLAALAADVAKERETVSAQRLALQAMEQSLSWRLTAPLRKMVTWFK